VEGGELLLLLLLLPLPLLLLHVVVLLEHGLGEGIRNEGVKGRGGVHGEQTGERVVRGEEEEAEILKKTNEQ